MDACKCRSSLIKKLLNIKNQNIKHKFRKFHDREHKEELCKRGFNAYELINDIIQKPIGLQPKGACDSTLTL